MMTRYMTFGRMWRKRRRASLAPRARAASTYSMLFTFRVSPRMSLQRPTQEVTPRAMQSCQSPLSMTMSMAMRRSMPGMDESTW